MKRLILWACIFTSSSSLAATFDFDARLEANDLEALSHHINQNGLPNYSGEWVLKAARSNKTDMVEILLDNGADPNWVVTDGYLDTALMQAAGNNNISLLKALLDRGADIDARDKNGDPAINWATYMGHQKAVELLLKHGARTDLIGHGTALGIALRMGRQSIINSLSAHVGQRCILGPQQRSLVEAVIANDKSKVENFLTEPRLANSTDFNCQPLMLVAAQHGAIDVISSLLEMGADVNVVNSIGFTPLMVAAREGHLNVIMLLLSKGANVNTRANVLGLLYTALHAAAASNHSQVIKALLEHKANPDFVAYKGGTPLHWAMGQRHLQASETLVRLGANTSINFESGYSIQQLAMDYKWQNLLKMIEENP